MRKYVWIAVALVVVAALAAAVVWWSGSRDAEVPADVPIATTSTPSPEPSSEPTAPVPLPTADVTWLRGVWTMMTTLETIDNELMRSAADQPEARWECQIDGGSMRMTTSEHTYEGAITTPTESFWRYEGVSTYTDSDGAVWTSTITVEADRLSADAFAGVMKGTISSDTTGHLYTATWAIDGVRAQ